LIPGRDRDFSLFATASSPALGPIQPPFQWVQGPHIPGVKRPWREADHSPPCNAEVKNVWSYTSIPSTFSRCDAYLNNECVFLARYLVKRKGNFIFTFFLPCSVRSVRAASFTSPHSTAQSVTIFVTIASAKLFT
jgi:hypothetical protein